MIYVHLSARAWNLPSSLQSGLFQGVQGGCARAITWSLTSRAKFAFLSLGCFLLVHSSNLWVIHMHIDQLWTELQLSTDPEHHVHFFFLEGKVCENEYVKYF